MSTIPRVVHQVWLGADPPAQVKEWMSSWRDIPGWSYRLWTQDNLPRLRNQALYDAADTFAVPGRGHQVRSDLVRWELLHDHGGVYVDADFELLGDPERLLVGDCFAGWEVEPDAAGNGGWVNMALAGAVPGHPFLQDLIGEAAVNVARYAGQPGITSSTSLTGPRYLTGIWRRHADDVYVHPQRLLYPLGWREVGTSREAGPFPDAVAVHWWMNRRRLLGLMHLDGD